MMKYQSRKYVILRDRRAHFCPGYFNAICQSSPVTRKIHGVTFNSVWMYWHHGKQLHFFLQSEWDKIGRQLGNKLFINRQYFLSVKSKLFYQEIKLKKFIKLLERADIKYLSFRQLTDLALKIEKKWLDYDQLNVPPWFFGGDFFREKVNKKLKILSADFLLLTTPEQKTFNTQLEEELYNTALKYHKNREIINKLADSLSQKFGAIPFGYDGPIYWDSKYFIKKINQLAKKYSANQLTQIVFKIKKQNQEKKYLSRKIISGYKFSSREILWLDQLKELAVWTDVRKHLEFRLHYFYDQIIRSLAQQYKISRLDLKYLTPHELKGLQNNHSELCHLGSYRRHNKLVICASQGQIKFLPDKDAKKIINRLSQIQDKQEIKGMVASYGNKEKYRGRAKILLSPRQADKIKTGDFLVATMTSPDYLLAMDKAAGFITDEGGVTCHAAIVAREMNKPCIIATSIATKFLKDGDNIELDIKKGTVRKI